MAEFFKKYYGILISLVLIYFLLKWSSDSADKYSSSNRSSAAATKPSEQNEAVTLTKVISIKGEGSFSSQTFHLNGNKAFLHYSYSSILDVGIFAIYVMDSKQDFARDGGFPEIMKQKSVSNEESSLHKQNGDYYLYINSANGPWNIDVYEYR